MTDKRDEEKRQSQLAYMRRMLKPISRERAREIADTYTKHMHESVARTTQQQAKAKMDESDD